MHAGTLIILINRLAAARMAVQAVENVINEAVAQGPSRRELGILLVADEQVAVALRALDAASGTIGRLQP